MYTVIRKIIWLIYKIYYNISFEGVENIPKEGGYIYASNHRSYADPVVISIPVRKRFAYMAKKELFEKPLFGTLIRIMGAFPIDRGSGDMKIFEIAEDKLRKGKNLAIFPEGTRSKDGKVGKGKSGVALIAARANADIIPVGIVFEGKLKFRKKITVRYGKPIPAKELAIGEKPNPAELKKLKNKIMAAITELVEK